MNQPPSPVIDNRWETLRQFTDARIALGRAGVSLPTRAHLDFQLAHAKARDAVHLALDVPQLTQSLSAALGAWAAEGGDSERWPQRGQFLPDLKPHSPAMGRKDGEKWTAAAALQPPILLPPRLLDPQGAPCLALHSACADRTTYLQRPDWGRRLDEASRERLQALRAPGMALSKRPYDLAFVVADGLSALAIAQNAAPFLAVLQRRMALENWSVAPVCIVEQARVAIGDEVAQLLGAKAVVVLIGERPGLSSPDSMGLYLTWMPRIGLNDASRNCISNVRPTGLCYEEAAYKLHHLLSQSRRRQLSGVDLKDETGAEARLTAAPQKNFLLE
jgi:ethanolamine ammonia-lyase small subunit